MAPAFFARPAVSYVNCSKYLLDCDRDFLTFSLLPSKALSSTSIHANTSYPVSVSADTKAPSLYRQDPVFSAA